MAGRELSATGRPSLLAGSSGKFGVERGTVADRDIPGSASTARGGAIIVEDAGGGVAIGARAGITRTGTWVGFARSGAVEAG